jgi:hypothetical protein
MNFPMFPVVCNENVLNAKRIRKGGGGHLGELGVGVTGGGEVTT